MSNPKHAGAPPPSKGASQDSGKTRPTVFKRTGRLDHVRLEDVDHTLVVTAVDRAIETGVLVSIGRTSDGGAIGVYLTYDGEREKAWAGNDDELRELFESIASAYEGL